VWRGQTFQAEAATLVAPVGSQDCTPTTKCGGGKRVSWIRAGTGLTLTGVNVAAGGTNNMVVYYTNGDPLGYGFPTRTLLVSVNGGAVQSRDFPPTGAGWSDVASITISLSGFVTGSNNTVRFSGSATAQAPDLDWFEVVNTTAASSAAVIAAETSCSVGHTISLKSYNNSEYASARGDTSTMAVIAQAGTVSTWEQFDIVDAGAPFVAFKSHMNSKYLTVNTGASNAVQASAASIGANEKFTLEIQTDGTFGIKANANGKYMQTAGGGANAPLQAAGNTVSQTSTSWEKFACQ
jgi:hypothetical protein